MSAKIAPPEIIEIPATADEVSCDGGGAFGHPKVWYSFDAQDIVECGYCDRQFVKQAASNASHS